MHAEPTAPRPTQLQRLPRDDDGFSRYLHPHGYVIVANRRTWSERVGALRGQAGGVPLTWWEVYRHLGTADDVGTRYHAGAHYGRTLDSFDTLRDAREWCDCHPRNGWEEN
jgi:hypothetical protein